MRPFDPIRLGEHEATAWASYYQRRWGTFLRAAFGMIRAGFDLPWSRTVRGAWFVLRANQCWAPYPDNDPIGARDYMRRFYTLVERTHRTTFDVAEAARLEVEWWRVHRRLQREAPEEDIAPLVDAIAALYAHIYAAPLPGVRPAAAHRARAMRISDGWVAAGCAPDSPALSAERDELIQGYALLQAAVATRTEERRGEADPTPA